MMRRLATPLFLLFVVTEARANPPVAAYIFPAGGQRGKAVDVRVGGLFLHDRSNFVMTGPGVEASKVLAKTPTVWFEGPRLPLPDSQRAEDYPRDMAGRVQIAVDAPVGSRSWQVWTSQGASKSLRFVVGDLPEIVEREIDGAPVPEAVTLPVTINGRIFPREDVDVWTFTASKGQPITCSVQADRLGAPLDARLEIRDAAGNTLAENDDAGGNDPTLHFTPPADGEYQVRIHDIAFNGSQAHVYRLTITSGPHVDRVYPLGGKRGSTVAFELAGHGLPVASASVALPAHAPGGFTQRFQFGEATTNAVPIDLDDLPEHLEAEPNNEAAQVKPVDLPAILNGRIGTAGDVDCWAVTLRKGDKFDFDLKASRLGSPLDAILVLEDAAGKQLARGDNPNGDPSVNFTAAVDGVVIARVESRFRSRGGPAQAYRLCVRQAVPDFRLRLERDDLTVPRGGQAALKLTVDRLGGFSEALQVSIDGLPAGLTASCTIPAKQTTGTLTVKAEATAPIKAQHVTVSGLATIDGKPVTRSASEPLLVAPAVATPFKFSGTYVVRLVPRGTVYQRRYVIERGGFTGPLQVSLADRQARHLQGVTGPAITVPANATEFDYTVNLPPWLETGRTARVTLMAVGIVKDADGSEHAVSFTSVNQNEQLVAVIEPGRLSIAGPGSLAVETGQAAKVAVVLQRGADLKGPIRVELIAPAHLAGVNAAPLEIAADADRGELTLNVPAELKGPFNAPVLLRATVIENGLPVTAETKLELLTRVAP